METNTALIVESFLSVHTLVHLSKRVSQQRCHPMNKRMSEERVYCLDKQYYIRRARQFFLNTSAYLYKGDYYQYNGFRKDDVITGTDWCYKKS